MLVKEGAELTVAELSKVQADICERPNESHNEQLKIVIIVGGMITYTAVLLRFISLYLLAQIFGLDDWFILSAVVSMSCLLNIHIK